MKSYSTEQLSKISNEELEKEFLAVRSEINSARRSKQDSLDLEVYFCYVSREYQLRDQAKKNFKKSTHVQHQA